MTDPLVDEHGEWTGPLQAPPFWLRPEMEVTERRPEMTKSELILLSVEQLLSLRLTTSQSISIVANTIGEIGWKLKFRAWNLGGVKIKKATATDPNGAPRQWWRALGHKKSGDPHTCFYRAYPSLAAYYKEWVAHYVPRPPNTGRYGATGARFWAGQEWYPALCAAGYKGPVTEANPEKSIAAHRSLMREIGEYWAQHLLGGLTVDGAWGPKSRARCEAWQEEHGLPQTGVLDERTRALLFR